jgi:6-phosphofructokinase 1
VNNGLRKIGVLSSGGDAPGMNASTRAIVRTASGQDIEVVGFLQGYRGLVQNLQMPLGRREVGNIIQRGGTILGTSRCKEFLTPEGRTQAVENLRQENIDALLVLGGNGSFRGAHALASEFGARVIGIPCTIDNDLVGTDYTLGFDTAVNIALDAIDRIRDTAESFERLFFVEVMGNTCGSIALEVGVAGGADEVLLPENPTDIEVLCEHVQRGFDHGRRSSIVVVAEGGFAGGAFGVAQQVWMRLRADYRVCVLGHIQRGGSPTARDRVLGSKLGSSAVEALLAGHDGCMVGEVDGNISLTPLQQTWDQHREIDRSLLDLAHRLTH